MLLFHRALTKSHKTADVNSFRKKSGRVTMQLLTIIISYVHVQTNH